MPEVGQWDVVEITGVMDDPDPLPIGARGQVELVLNVGTQFEQYVISWDLTPSRSLMLLPGDPFRVV